VKSLVVLLHLLVNEPAPPLASVAPWLPPELCAIVAKAMSQDREQRHHDASELLAALMSSLPEGAELRQDMLVGRQRRSR
jgi:hypothetical protein